MLNSAQLHYLLEHYKLSVTRPDHWTPSEGDEEEAYNLGTVIMFVLYDGGMSCCGHLWKPYTLHRGTFYSITRCPYFISPWFNLQINVLSFA